MDCLALLLTPELFHINKIEIITALRWVSYSCYGESIGCCVARAYRLPDRSTIDLAADAWIRSPLIYGAGYNHRQYKR